MISLGPEGPKNRDIRYVSGWGAIRSLFVAVVFSSFCVAQAIQFETTVTPLPSEDIAGGCHYAVTIPAPDRPVAAVWVIFDRGHDVHDLYTDSAVLAFAHRFQIALLLHGHCPGKEAEDHNDMNMDPNRGLGRALYTALDQFATAAGHPELSKAKLIFLGFSGAGPLAARLVGASPERTLAAILSCPGHYEPLGIDTVNLNASAAAVPEMIIVGSADSVSGTARPYSYFQKYRVAGTRWTFVVQNKSPHCCTANARDMMLHCLEEVIQKRLSRSELRDTDRQNGWFAFIKVKETQTKDSFGLKTFEALDVKIQRSNKSPNGWLPAGWLPTHATASEWMSFVQEKQHPILPLH